MKGKQIAIIGLGSGGSAVADMLARAGVGRLTLVDPDELTADNVKRHVLDIKHVGKSKVHGMAEKYGLDVIRPVWKKFDAEVFAPLVFHADPGGRYERSQKPDVIVSCVDSLQCESQINEYALRNKIPAVFGGVHGDAHTVEVITVIPGETPCYDCYEREGPGPEPTQEKYTNPNYDATKMPHQEGLWCDVLMGASVQCQAVLGVLGIRERMAPLVLMSLRYPFKIETYSQKPGCAICAEDFSKLERKA